jgi:predicted nucleic acid-binding protein
MRVYLDNCAFNRPFDDQSYIRIKIESEAKLYVQKKIQDCELELIWSYILDFENEQNPYSNRKNAIKRWKGFACLDIEETSTVLERANKLRQMGLKAKDALHVASAIEGKAQYFLTTDDKILKKLLSFKEIKVIDPITFVKIFDNYDN